MATLYHMVTVYLYLSNWVNAHVGVYVADLLNKELLRELMCIRLKVREGSVGQGAFRPARMHRTM